MKASTHFGDMSGTISIDGFGGLTVTQILQGVKVPHGFFPVGVRIGTVPKGEVLSDAFVLCVDHGIAQNANEMRRFGDLNSEIPVTVFPCQIDLLALLSSLKRLDVMLVSNFADAAKLRIKD